MKRSFQIAYLAVGALTVLEFLFVRGMFTWLIMTIAVAAAAPPTSCWRAGTGNFWGRCNIFFAVWR